MNTAPKTIQIFLPGGDPRGIRIAEVTTRIVQVIEVPRSLLAEFLALPQTSQVAVYFLIGESDDGTQKVYVGQTGDVAARLTAHNKEKDFWQRALVLVSRTNSLTQTHGLFLEWHCLQAIRRAARFSDENGNAGSKPHTPAPLEADCIEVFETARVLLATLGYSLFDAPGKASARKKEEVLYCKASGANGLGIYTEEGFVVLKGSTGRKEVVPSFTGTKAEQDRAQLLKAGVLRESGDVIAFEKDHVFRTPSAAAMVIMGRTANGWIDWKNERGETLHQLKREVRA